MKDTEKFIEFVQKSPSPFHAVEQIRVRLEESGFKPLYENRRFSVQPGGSYYVIRNGSAIIAFTVPSDGYKGYSIVSAHTDSPTFTLKGEGEMTREGCTLLNVEGYGGMLCAPWFDRPLGIAGRAVKVEDGQPVSIPVDLPVTVTIPSLAIHMDRNANSGKEIKVQKMMMPVLGLGERKIGPMLPDGTVSADLSLYLKEPGFFWGVENEGFSSPKIDDLECAYAAVSALTESKARDYIPMCALFDNEETGSGTKQGALSDFLISVIWRVEEALGSDIEQREIHRSNSSMLSADNGHACHPNFPEMCDPVHRPELNRGVLIKHSANQKYTTDAVSSAILIDLLEKNGIAYQHFYNHSDHPGGSTLGNLSARHFSIPTVDIGLAQWAMHSAMESAGSRDLISLVSAMRLWYER